MANIHARVYIGRMAPKPSRSEPAVRLAYDPAVDALSLELVPDAEAARSVRVADGLTLDFDREGRLIAVELLDASWHAPRAALERLPSAGRLLTLAEAAVESGLSPGTLRVQLNKGRLAGEKRGRDWVVSESALLTYLDSRDARGRPPAAVKAAAELSRPRGGRR